MTQEQSQVREFHRVFGLTLSDKPTPQDNQTSYLRRVLMQEELNEFMDADSEDDLTGIADALADLLYVLLGTANAYGIDLEPVFQEVHRSNMTKLWTIAEELAAPTNLEFFCASCGSTEWADCSCEAVPSLDKKCLVAKRQDGKVIKSPSYEPANIAAIIKKQMQP